MQGQLPVETGGAVVSLAQRRVVSRCRSLRRVPPAELRLASVTIEVIQWPQPILERGQGEQRVANTRCSPSPLQVSFFWSFAATRSILGLFSRLFPPFERAMTTFGAVACGAPQSLARCTNCFMTWAMRDAGVPSTFAMRFVEELPRARRARVAPTQKPRFFPGTAYPM